MATYGIDLGTTNSCIARVDKTLRPVVLKSFQGEDTTPSVVYFESARRVVVGRQAKNSALLVPQLVRELVKRDMGQDVRYEYHGQSFTPESVSALILRALAIPAEEQTGEPVEDVVITVPAYFGLQEREATRRAGQIAGLNVLDVLPEPVAAALSYQSISEDTATRHIFVYDLGGGTFDTTVMRLEGNDVQVVCVDGNHRLGGAEWDQKVMDFLLQGFAEQYPQLDPGGDEQFMQDLATSAEELKKALSAVQSRRHNMRFDGSVVSVELSREHIEELTAELLEQTMEITGKTLATARDRGVDAIRRRAAGRGHDEQPGDRPGAEGAVPAGREAAGPEPGRGQGGRAVRADPQGPGEQPGGQPGTVRGTRRGKPGPGQRYHGGRGGAARVRAQADRRA